MKALMVLVCLSWACWAAASEATPSRTVRMVASPILEPPSKSSWSSLSSPAFSSKAWLFTSKDGNNNNKNSKLPLLVLRGGGYFHFNLIPAGYNPFGYKITPLGERFLEFGDCLDSDVGRLLASLRKRSTFTTIQATWLEIVRVSKKGQAMRIYRTLQDLIDFCLEARLID